MSQYEPITTGQLKAFTGAFLGHPNFSRIMETARTLSRKQAHEIVNAFYGTSYGQMKAVSETARENAKAKIPKALAMLESHGYVTRCGICRAPRKECNC